jgi:WD40 repeat protein
MIPKTQLIVSSGYDSAVALFDLESGNVSLLGYHEHLVNSIAINAKGDKAASCSSDHTIRIWDLKTKQTKFLLQGHVDDVEEFIFIDENYGASASRDRCIIVWDIEACRAIRVLEGHEKDVLTLAYHEGKLYSSGDDMTLRMWDIDSGCLLRIWGPFENETDTCALDPQRNRVILGCDDGCIRILDFQTGDLVKTIAAHKSGIKKVTVSLQTGDILSAAYDQKLLIWDAKILEQKLALERMPFVWERSLRWTPDGNGIIAGTFEGTVILWNAVDGKLKLEVGQSSQEHGNACFNDVSAADHGDIALASDDGLIRFGKLTEDHAAWQAKVEPPSGRMLMNAIALDTVYGLVIGGSHDHKLHIVSQKGDTFSNPTEVFLGEGPINSVRISHHQGYEADIFVGCYSGNIIHVKANEYLKRKISVHKGAVKSLRLHPHKPIGVSCGADGILHSWYFNGESLRCYAGHQAIINDLDLDPTGTLIASVSRDFTIKVFDLWNGEMLHCLPIGKKSLKSVCFWERNWLVIGDYWGSLIGVDINTHQLIKTKIASNGISALSRMESCLVAASYEGIAFLVDPYSLKVVNELRAMHQKVDGV